MTATAARHIDPAADADTRSKLAHHLGQGCFPATQDELQATLIRVHAPARLLWELMPLSPTRRYPNLGEVFAELDHPSVHETAREPI
ncbi:DUF2795 domain-containing protein [Pedococcus sp. 5OH_020]|uniref:DUF2795 domain-containing protein n=1 Tax=Pedococcus sp. 5OH_020 TaxID=2989814 RepID=UPI0022E9F255|nr:hypothetical protein [Pedococcus sp. 5OH_020]